MPDVLSLTLLTVTFLTVTFPRTLGLDQMGVLCDEPSKL